MRRANLEQRDTVIPDFGNLGDTHPLDGGEVGSRVAVRIIREIRNQTGFGNRRLNR